MSRAPRAAGRHPSWDPNSVETSLIVGLANRVSASGAGAMLVVMGKYDPLFEYLCRADDGRLEMTFKDIEQLVGPLPASASVHPAWWANEAKGGRHVQARAWLNAGREVESVDRAARRVVFSGATWRRGS